MNEITYQGWIGFKYCPNCFSNILNILSSEISKNEKGDWIFDNVRSSCPNCKWNGKYVELIDSENEMKNMKRTKLIERMLE